jgi:hypothetical protein
MKSKVCGIIKIIALIIGAASLYVGIHDFFDSLNQYRDYSMDIAKAGMINALIILFGGAISAVLIYGFGELIECVSDIRDKLIGKETPVLSSNINVSDSKADLLASANGNASTWTCKKCGKSNNYDKVYCPECGEYK